MPLDNCIYEPVSGKIFASYGNYLYSYYANGIKETQVKYAGIVRPPTCIAVLNGKVYVNAWHCPSGQQEHLTMGSNFPVEPHPYKGLWQINPVSLAIENHVDVNSVINHLDSYPNWENGALSIVGANNQIYGVWTSGGGATAATTFHWLFRVDPLNIATWESLGSLSERGGRREVIGIGDSKVFFSSIWFNNMYWADWNNIGGATFGDTSVAPHTPVGCVYSTVTSKVYVVCGDEIMLRLDDWPTDTHTHCLLGAVKSDVTPTVIRENPYNGLLYIPCQEQDGVIVWSPATETGIWKNNSGAMSNPIDVCFTPTKTFVAQTVRQGLVELL